MVTLHTHLHDRSIQGFFVIFVYFKIKVFFLYFIHIITKIISNYLLEKCDQMYENFLFNLLLSTSIISHLLKSHNFPKIECDLVYRKKPS